MDMRSSHWLVVVFAAANFTQLSARLTISPLVPYLIELFEITKSEIGLAMTVMWGAYALTQFPSGVLGDRFGERAIVLTAMSLLVAGNFLVVFAPSFPVFAMALVVVGIGAGLYFPAGANFLNRRFEHTGRVFGLHTAGASLSGLLVPASVAFLAVTFDWRVAATLILVLEIPLLAVFVVAVSPTPPERPGVRIRDRLSEYHFRAVFSRLPVVYTLILGAIFSFSFQSIATFFPTFLEEYASLTTLEAGVSFSALFLVGAVALPVLGAAYDRWNRDLVLLCPIATSVAGYSLLLFEPVHGALVLGIGLLGIGFAAGGILQARLMDALTTAEEGVGFGMGRTIYVTIGALGGVVTGLLADAAGWIVAYGIVIGILSLAGASLGVVGLRTVT